MKYEQHNRHFVVPFNIIAVVMCYILHINDYKKKIFPFMLEFYVLEPL